MTALDVDRLVARLRVPAGPLHRVEVVARTGSTNADLVAAVADDPAGWPAPSALLADHQEAGRGRAGRTWTTPPGSAVTVSVTAPVAPSLPLAVGVAVVRALADTGVAAALKWPNDAVVAHPEPVPGWGPWRKVAGLLVEVATTPAGPVAVVGVGVNVTGVPDGVPHAAALADVAGAAGGPDRQRVAEALLVRLAGLAGLDPAAPAALAGLNPAAPAVLPPDVDCVTLGRAVRVELPGGEAVTGTAVRLASDGGLVLATAEGERTVLAGDVHHLREA